MSKENHENEKMDAAAVYVMFEELKDEMKAAKNAPPPASVAVPMLESEDRERINALNAKLDGVDRRLDIPLKHHHIIDPVGNVGLIAWFGVVAMLVATLFVIHSQGDTIARNRDNDLKYRYIQMQGKASEADILRLREHFEWNRNAYTIRTIRRQVEQYERLMQQKSEEDAREETAAANSERLKNAAESVKGER